MSQPGYGNFPDSADTVGPRPNLRPVNLFDTLKPLEFVADCSGRRNRFIQQYDWVPGSKREVTLASHEKGVAEILFFDRYAGNSHGRPLEDQLKAPAKDYDLMINSMNESRRALTFLRRAVVPTDEGIPAFDHEQLATNAAIQGLFVDYVLDHRRLDAFDWPVWNSELLKNARLNIEDQVARLSSTEREQLWEIVRASHAARANFWGGQIHYLRANNKIVRDIEEQRLAVMLKRDEYNLGMGEEEIPPESASQIAENAEPDAAAPDQTESALTGMPWHTYEPGGQMKIEGANVPQVTTEPEEVVVNPAKNSGPKPDELFPVSAVKKGERARRPYRARFKDSTDYSVQEQKSALEGDKTEVAHPDADIEEVFGAENAHRIVK